MPRVDAHKGSFLGKKKLVSLADCGQEGRTKDKRVEK